MLGGVIGEPVAEPLIGRFRLAPVPTDANDGGVITGPEETPVTTMPAIGALTAALVAVVIGQWLGGVLAEAPVKVPDFLLCLLAGLVLRNLGAVAGLQLHGASMELIGSVGAVGFPGLDDDGARPRRRFRMAGPLLAILAVQVVLVALWASLITFRLVGRDYESAIMAAAFCGFAMGATATAIANM